MSSLALEANHALVAVSPLSLEIHHALIAMSPLALEINNALIAESRIRRGSHRSNSRKAENRTWKIEQRVDKGGRP